MRYSLALAALVLAAPAFARDVYVQPHVRNDGTYVQGHMRSTPDSSRLNNYSTEGNYNPYTGQAGTQNPYPAYNPQPMPAYPSFPAYQNPYERR